jgi:hypothetical protein
MSLTTLFPFLYTHTPTSIWSTHPPQSPILRALNTLITACKSDPMIENHIGKTCFTTYTATTPTHLSLFLYMINAHPPLAAYVSKISLDADFDAADRSGVYDMLLYSHAFSSASSTSSELLHWLADEFWLVSMEDATGVPDRVFYAIVSELWRVARNVKSVEMPRQWQRGFDALDVFPRLEGRDLMLVETVDGEAVSGDEEDEEEEKNEGDVDSLFQDENEEIDGSEQCSVRQADQERN